MAHPATKQATPALKVTGRQTICIAAGTSIGGRKFAKTTQVRLATKPEPGCDYGVVVTAKTVEAEKLTAAPVAKQHVAGFHVAPGGNAGARAGGDDRPAINPCSVWDTNFRPACPDPRGMVFVPLLTGGVWVDIYLLGRDHLANGTSKFGVTIADGNDPPQQLDGGSYFAKLDYDTATAVMRHHGKELLSFEQFGLATYGVTEKTAAGVDPKVTGLDAPRTSKFGLMQATGNLWVWGHDGDPDQPRASGFGGSWFSDGHAGSRDAGVGFWPGDSIDCLGARGRCDPWRLISRRGSAGRKR